MEGKEQGKAHIPEGMEKKVNDYVTILMTIMHGPETRDGVINTLKSSKDPYVTVPTAANMVNDAARMKIQQANGNIDEETMLAASQYLVGDLLELGQATGQFQVEEGDFEEIYQDTLQMYIERGLKDGSIDPIELQLAGEKFMSTNQKLGGQYLAQQNGLGYQPSQGQMMTQFGRQSEAKGMARATEANAQKNKEQMEAMQQNQALMQGGQGNG